MAGMHQDQFPDVSREEEVDIEQIHKEKIASGEWKYTELNEGCNYLRCPLCNKEWCFECGRIKVTQCTDPLFIGNQHF